MLRIFALVSFLLVPLSAHAQFAGCAPSFCAPSSGRRSLSSGPQVPAPAAAHGYTHVIFNETWSNPNTAIDYNNTHATGYDFYVQTNNFPINYANDSRWTWMASTSNATAAGNTISNHVLTMGSDGSVQLIWSCGWNGSQMVGHWWGGGFYIEVQFAFDPALAPGGGARPSFWFFPKETLGTSTLLSTDSLEIDFESLYGVGDDPFCEGNGNCSFSMYVHDWNFSKGGNNSYNGFNWSQLQSAFANFSYKNLNTYGLLVVPSNQNNGTGLISRFVNGVLMFSQTYTRASGSSPAVSPDNPGAIADADNVHWCLALDNGVSWRSYFGNIRAWQLPATGVVAKPPVRPRSARRR
jgi:hypothetical protein